MSSEAEARRMKWARDASENALHPLHAELATLVRAIDTAEADLAAARAREQRLRLAAEQACAELEDEAFVFYAAQRIVCEPHPFADAVVAIKEQLRAALAAEPAATLAEPEGATESQQATSLGGLGAADTRSAKPSGSASAAADEPGERE